MRGAGILAGAFLAVACGGGEAPPAEPTPEAGAPAPAEPGPEAVVDSPGEGVASAPPGPRRGEWTAGIVDVERPAVGVALLVSVRAAAHDGFDRVVWEFAGEGVPGYHVEYVDRPVRECGSGRVVPLPGDGWLAVRLSPAAAHDEAGRPTAAPRARSPGLPVVLELRSTCDFEAIVEWVLGVRSPNRYRVLELADPPRLVVDVRH